MNYETMLLDNNQKAFLELLKAGLWADAESTELRIQGFTESVDWEEVYQLTAEQSVAGVVLAGIERLKNDNPNFIILQEILLQWIGEVQIIEQQNKAMNEFVAKLIDKLRKEDVYAVLVKGQGIAQCYEKPLWRVSGDVDLLLSEENYQRAKKILIPLADDVEQEYKSFKHIGMTLNGEYVVELHGTLHSRLSNRIDRGIDEAQKDVFFGGNVRSWINGSTLVFLPAPDNNVIFIFIHILHHFYIEGIGLRQICDWCRLLWTYKDSLDRELLDIRIRKMGLITEWKAFAAFAVEYLGMPVEAMPFYNVRDMNQRSTAERKVKDDVRWKKKAEHILRFVLESGNFGHNREKTHGKILSAWSKTKDFVRHAKVFPVDSVKFFWHFLWNGVGLMLQK